MTHSGTSIPPSANALPLRLAKGLAERAMNEDDDTLFLVFDETEQPENAAR